jgi:hypothetical protein
MNPRLVSDVEVNLPDDMYAQLQRIAEEEFLNEQDAIEHMLSAGIEAYRPQESDEDDLAEEFHEEMWDTAGDPAARDEYEGAGDDYTF